MREEEAGYVLSERFKLWEGGQYFQLSQGNSVRVSSQEPHKYGNPGEEDTMVLWITGWNQQLV